MKIGEKLDKVSMAIINDYYNPRSTRGSDNSLVISAPTNIENIFRYLHEHGFRESVLDLGSGNGLVCLIAATFGFNSYGIEKDEDLVARSREIYERLRNKRIVPGNCEFVQGDYLDTNGVNNPYQKLGKEFKDFRIVFCYPWSNQVESVWNLFKHKGSYGQLLVVWSWGREIERDTAFREVFEISPNYRAVMLNEKETKIIVQ